jgi:spoIIIJ-associated protein
MTDSKIVENLELTDAIVENAKLTLKEIITSMGFICDISVKSYEKNTIYLVISGQDDPGLLIGKNGSTMKALQTILSTILSKKLQNKVYIKIDVNDYWKRREDEIVAAALDAAKVASEEEISVMLEPMNAEERRVVHLAIEKNELVFSYSEGVGPIKQVVVAHKKFQSERTAQPS